MSKYISWIDQDAKELIIEYDNNYLLNKYYLNFINLVKSRIQIEGIIKTTKKIRFQCPLDLKIKDKLWNIYKQFIKKAYELELKITEFIPLDSTKDLKEDISRIIKEKRNINLVKDGSELNDNIVSEGLNFNQYLINFDTDEDEYTDFILAIQNGKFDEMKRKYQDKLTLVNWC